MRVARKSIIRSRGTISTEAGIGPARRTAAVPIDAATSRRDGGLDREIRVKEGGARRGGGKLRGRGGSLGPESARASYTTQRSCGARHAAESSCLRGAPLARLHAAQQQPFAPSSACSMGRAELGGHHQGCAPPKAPGPRAQWLTALPMLELHRRSVPKAQKLMALAASRSANPSLRQHEPSRRQNTPRASCTPGRSRALAMAPTLPCPPCWGAFGTPAGGPGAVPALFFTPPSARVPAPRVRPALRRIWSATGRPG